MIAMNEISPKAKQADLDRRLRDLGGLLVAYSGGVDSAYLAWRAHEVLGGEMRAVLADSPSLARRHFREAPRSSVDTFRIAECLASTVSNQIFGPQDNWRGWKVVFRYWPDW